MRVCVWIGWVAGCSTEAALRSTSELALPSPGPITTSYLTPPPGDGGSTGSEARYDPAVVKYPADGAVDVFAHTAVWFELGSPEPEAVITVADAQGEVVSGDTVVDGTRVTWSGAPLEPGAVYVATLSATHTHDIVEFATSEVGAPLDVDVAGLAYAVEPARGTWVEPADLAELLVAQTEGTALLLAVSSARQRVDLIAAQGTLAEQDVCAPTTSATSSAWVDPTFTLSSAMLPLTVGGSGVALDELGVVAAFDADGTRVQFGRVTARVDTRQLSGVKAYAGLDLCAGGCVPCADDVARCLPVVVDGLEGSVVAVDVATRTSDQIADDIVCR